MYVSYVIANDKFGVSNMLRTGEVIAVVFIMMIGKQSVNVQNTTYVAMGSQTAK